MRTVAIFVALLISAPAFSDQASADRYIQEQREKIAHEIKWANGLLNKSDNTN